MFPVLFEIPNAWKEMAGGALIVEIVLVVASLLGWIALSLRGRKTWVASALNLAAFIGGAHLLLSFAMERITIYSFGVVIIAGFLAGSSYILRLTRPLGLPDKRIFDFAFWMLVVGIVGSRLLYAALNWDHFSTQKGEIFRIWNGGLVWYGGMIPAVIVGLALLARYKLPILTVADIAGAALMLALGIGRWACFLAGDDYGRPTSLPWGITFTNSRSLVAPDLRGIPLHPTQLYMSLKALWIFFAVDWIRRRARHAGVAFASMLILYAVARAVVIEPFRGDFVERNPGYAEHLAIRIRVEKGAGTPPVQLRRGMPVQDSGGKIQGVLLADLSLPEGEASGFVLAMSDGRFAGKRESRPDWSVDAIAGLPEGVRVTSDTRTSESGIPRYQGWYGSHMPRPPGYVSTSQWISILVVLAGVGMLVLSRRIGAPPYGALLTRASRESATGGGGS